MKKLLLSILFIALSCSSGGGTTSSNIRDALDRIDTSPLTDSTVPDQASPDQGQAPTLPRISFIADKGFSQAVLDAIRAAKTSIDVTELEFRDSYYTDSIRVALVNAQKPGVQVRVILEDLDGNIDQVNAMKKGGVTVKYGDYELHAKTLVIDGRVVFVGSTNFSQSSLKYNHETDFRFNDTGIGAAFEHYFNELWANPYPRASTGTCSGGVTCFGDAKYYDNVLPLLKSAKRRVYMVMYQITQSTSSSTQQGKLCQALINARKQGADVRVVLERTDYKNDPNTNNQTAAAMLKRGGVQVRFDRDSVITHAKMLVVDDAVVVSTNNWTKAGLQKNHEAGVIVRDSTAVHDAIEYFEKVWGQSR